MLNPWSTGSDEESDSEEKEGTTITHSNSSPAINCLGIRLGSIGYVDLGTSVQEAVHGYDKVLGSLVPRVKGGLGMRKSLVVKVGEHTVCSSAQSKYNSCMLKYSKIDFTGDCVTNIT